MKAQVLLADWAEVVNGKVYGMGIGWNVTGTPTPPQTVVIILDVGWDETNRDIKIHAELLDGDGHAVMVPGPMGNQPIQLDAQTQVGRPPGVAPGTPFKLPMTIQIGPGLPLEPGRYEWRVAINGKNHGDWTETFTVQAQPPQQA